MNSLHSPFENIDHPLIYFAQAACAIGLFVYFFKLRHSVFPIPQIVAGLAFAVLYNLVCRVTHSTWFVGADIAQYCVWAGLIWTAVFVVEKREELRTEEHLPDWLDRNHYALITFFCAAVANVVIYGIIRQYNEQQATEAEKDRLALRASTEASERAEAAHRQSIAYQTQAAEARAVIQNDLDSLKNSQKALLKQVGKKSATTALKADEKKLQHIQTTTDSTAKQVEDIHQALPDSSQSGRSTKPVPKKPWWKRLFSKRGPAVPADTSGLVQADSLRVSAHNNQ